MDDMVRPSLLLNSSQCVALCFISWRAESGDDLVCVLQKLLHVPPYTSLLDIDVDGDRQLDLILLLDESPSKTTKLLLKFFRAKEADCAEIRSSNAIMRLRGHTDAGELRLRVVYINELS